MKDKKKLWAPSRAGKNLARDGQLCALCGTARYPHSGKGICSNCRNIRYAKQRYEAARKERARESCT